MSRYMRSGFAGPDPYLVVRPTPDFEVCSRDFSDAGQLPTPHQGELSISPHLSWKGFPPETKSFAVTMFDPDAPTCSGYWHWAVFNIPLEVTELPTGAGSSPEPVPGAVTLRGDVGEARYYGSQPPAGHGPHRYIFTVHAVDVEQLDIPAAASPAVLGFNLNFHDLARAITWGWDEN